MRIDYIERSNFEPKNKNVLWLHNGVFKYWNGGWVTIAGTGDGTVTGDMQAAYDYTDAQIKKVNKSVTSISESLTNMNTTISKMQEELDDYSEDTTTLSDSLEKLQSEITSTTKNLDEIKNWYEYS